jgi:ADP-ribose pyrophosphatase YjhB (NUDIX family)
VHYQGPSVVALTIVFAQQQLLLVRRGIAPYAGKWAPPGGYVEQDESLETAAAREVYEEVGIQLAHEHLIPNALVSLPHIGQICVVFLAHLDQRAPLQITQPEVLEAAWFKEEDYPSEHIWEPGSHFDARQMYEQVRVGRFDFYQQNEDFFRVISSDLSIRYLPQKK